MIENRDKWKAGVGRFTIGNRNNTDISFFFFFKEFAFRLEILLRKK
jgi:hypothetical protein